MMQGSDFDESEFFRAVQRSRARALLIGRRALVILGIPVLTADYDYWVHIDDAGAFNAAVERFGLQPTHDPAEARQRGRYVLQNDERVDVLLARSVPISSGGRIAFDDLWPRRREVDLGDGVVACIPSLDDLIATKRVASRPKDLEDIRLLELLREEGR